VTSTKKRFLVVDDEKLVRFFLKEFFNIHELPIEEAVNGKEAIKKWEQQDFAAILMDIKMPEIDGLEATRIIRRREKDEGRAYTPIFAVSGCTHKDFKVQCDNVGMDGFIPKPVDFDHLIKIILPLADN
jgi:CheY-like chemotaxis protein